MQMSTPEAKHHPSNASLCRVVSISKRRKCAWDICVEGTKLICMWISYNSSDGSTRWNNNAASCPRQIFLIAKYLIYILRTTKLEFVLWEDTDSYITLITTSNPTHVDEWWHGLVHLDAYEEMLVSGELFDTLSSKYDLMQYKGKTFKSSIWGANDLRKSIKPKAERNTFKCLLRVMLHEPQNWKT